MSKRNGNCVLRLQWSLLVLASLGFGSKEIVAADGFKLAFISAPLPSRHILSRQSANDNFLLHVAKPIIAWKGTKKHFTTTSIFASQSKDVSRKRNSTKSKNVDVRVDVFESTGNITAETVGNRSKAISRKRKSTKKVKYIDVLVEAVASKGNTTIETVVAETLNKRFQTIHYNETIELIFNEFETNPAKVVKTLPVKVVNALFTNLLNRCTTASLCKMFAEKCIKLEDTLQAKKLFKFVDYFILLRTFVKNARAKEDMIETTGISGVYADALLAFVAKNSNSTIETVVTDWVDATFAVNYHNETLELIFNDFELNPAKVVKAVPVKVLDALLAELLDRCTTESLCKIFAEKIQSALKELKEKVSLNEFLDHAFLFNTYAQLAGKKEKEIEKKSKTRNGSRIANLDFGMSSNMHSTFDLDRLSDRITELFQWFGSNKRKNFKRYLAPYFPMVQSSGTGKTRLLKSLKEALKDSNEIYCELFLCEPGMYGSKVHTDFVIQRMQNNKGEPDVYRTWDYLDSLLPKDKTKTKVVFLFDEAQKLLEKDAKYFRYIRWWLREKVDGSGKERSQKVVAVFTGTTSRLSNYYPETTMKISESRNMHSKYWNSEEGNYECFDPFYDLTTMGSVRFTEEGKSYRAENEYEHAALFGRPLFALLQIHPNKEEGLNDDRRYAILRRMLFGSTDTGYRLSESVWMNILGTRVQMGLVSFSMATKLVSSAYAHLVSFRPKSSSYAIENNKKLMDEDIAHICYHPDPVCAHLAMCLMDSNWNYSELSGCDPKFWTIAATELFSSGVCHPSKGDVGEVATALYLLFCGDKLRGQIDSRYMQFSVDLANFAEQLLQNCNLASKVKSPSNRSNATSKCTVNFIQVSRLHFRVPLKYLCSQEALEWMYDSACAMYLPTYERVFDILAPIKCVDEDGKSRFIPFMVTVKSQRGYTLGKVEQEFERMRNATNISGIENGLCLLVLLDAKNNPLTRSTELNLSDIRNNLAKKIVYKAIAIRNDPFGINKLVQNTRGIVDNTRSEIYSLHAILPSLPDPFWNKNLSRYTQADLRYAQRVSKPNSTLSKEGQDFDRNDSTT